jgi:hypothetical protein
MKMRVDFDQKAEQALNSLEGIQRAEPQPFFYTRIIGRLQQTQSLWEKTGSFISRPAVVFAGLVMILAFNIGMLLTQNGTDSNSSSSSVAEQLRTTDNEFILASSSSFDYENLDTQ